MDLKPRSSSISLLHPLGCLSWYCRFPLFWKNPSPSIPILISLVHPWPGGNTYGFPPGKTSIHHHWLGQVLPENSIAAALPDHGPSSIDPPFPYLPLFLFLICASILDLSPIWEAGSRNPPKNLRSPLPYLPKVVLFHNPLATHRFHPYGRSYQILIKPHQLIFGLVSSVFDMP